MLFIIPCLVILFSIVLIYFCARIGRPAYVRDKYRLPVLWLSIALYVASLTQVGFYVDRFDIGFHNDIGLSLVFWGAFQLLDGHLGLTWLANPILWFSWYQIIRLKPSLVGSALATATCLCFLLFDGYSSSCGSTDYSTVDCYIRIIGYGAGYYLWTASAIVLLSGNCMRYFLSTRAGK